MKNLLLFLSVAAVAVACSRSTNITGAWKNLNTMPANTKTIFVTALTDRTHVRQTVENDLAARLGEDGYKVIKSIDVLPPTLTDGAKPDKDQIAGKIDETGADAIVTVALIDEENESRYVPGNNTYAPVHIHGNFWGYFNAWSPTLYSPGYYEEEKVYFIQTNLYDADSEQLLWSAQSETYNPKTLKAFSSEFAKVVVERMHADSVLAKGAATDLATDR